MKTPREKYRHDPQYHALVNGLVNMVHECRFTPSELREACILASIIYEEDQVQRYGASPFDENVGHAHDVLNNWINKTIDRSRM